MSKRAEQIRAFPESRRGQFAVGIAGAAIGLMSLPPDIMGRFLIGAWVVLALGTLEVRCARVNTMNLVTTDEEQHQLVDDTRRWMADVENWLDAHADSANAEDFRTLTGNYNYSRLPDAPTMFGFQDGIRKRVRWLRMLNKDFGAVGDTPPDYN